MTKLTTFPMFAHKAPLLELGNLFSRLVLAKSHLQELDHKKGSCLTHFQPYPTQLTDTPQEEALRLDVQEVLKKA